MDVAVVEVFCAHIVDVVGGLEFAPVVDEVGVLGGEDLGFEVVDVAHGFVLHGVAEPGREVAFGVGPGDGVGHGDFTDGLCGVDGVG